MSVLAVMSRKPLIGETCPCWELTKYWTVFQTWDRVGDLNETIMPDGFLCGDSPLSVAQSYVCFIWMNWPRSRFWGNLGPCLALCCSWLASATCLPWCGTLPMCGSGCALEGLPWHCHVFIELLCSEHPLNPPSKKILQRKCRMPY